MKKLISKPNTIILLLTIIGGLFHFYNLTWGAPFYFHPDERNIASAVSQLQYPTQMNPNFFAYGSLPIYAIYFSGILMNYLSSLSIANTQTPLMTVSFSQAILISRFFSALFATILIPVLYIIARELVQKNPYNNTELAGLLAAVLATTSVGFIQFAHFGTFEMWLTLFGIILFWLCLRYLKKPHSVTLISLSITFGILVSIKVTSLALAPIPIALFILHSISTHGKVHHANKWNISNYQTFDKTTLLSFMSFLRKVLLFILIATIVYFISNPYTILDTKDFHASMNYESSVALGTEPVFYTQNFDNTIPGLYQLLHVYPFLLNPLIVLLFIPAFLFLLYTLYKHKNKQALLLISFFLLLFLSQAFLFVKWTRYLVPTLPFIYLMLAITFVNVIAKSETIKQSHKKVWHSFQPLALTGIILICFLFSFSYFKTAFMNQDTRIKALLFATKMLPTNAHILSEPSDLGALPFQEAFSHFDTFPFYNLDQSSPDATEAQLQQKLAHTDYVILLSQRLLQSRIENPKRFPKGHAFYTSLLNGKLGFHKIYETPCDVFCKITYMGDPVYWWEQTVSVFDRPSVFIFEKNTNTTD